MTKCTKSAEWFVEEYINKDRSRKDIAEECGLTIAGLKCVLAKYGIQKEKLSLKKEVLEDLINQNLRHTDIERILNIGQTTLYRYLKKYNLSIKAESVEYSAYDSTNDALICQLYLDGMSTNEIGNKLGITHRTVLNHLERCNIARRTLSESQWNFQKRQIPEEFSSYDTMYDLYITQRISKKDLAIRFDCDPCVIDRILNEFGIPVRSDAESKLGLMTGEKHWNWQGGITSLGMRLREYFGTNLTVQALQRDHYRCQLCGSKKDLHVHHIVPFSKILHRIIAENPGKNMEELYQIATHDAQFLDIDNLITYCKDCHFHKIHNYKS